MIEKREMEKIKSYVYMMAKLFEPKLKSKCLNRCCSRFNKEALHDSSSNEFINLTNAKKTKLEVERSNKDTLV